MQMDTTIISRYDNQDVFEIENLQQMGQSSSSLCLTIIVVVYEIYQINVTSRSAKLTVMQ
jgi:hypothetical protein